MDRTLGAEADPAARSFEAMYDRLLPRVFGYLLRRVGGDRARAEDLTQETFMAAVRSFDPLISNEEAWIITIARRRLIDHIRADARRPPIATTPDVPSTSEWPAGWDADEHAVLAALHRLGRDHQLALILHHIDGIPVEELAEHLGRSAVATTSLLARARRALRRAVEEETP